MEQIIKNLEVILGSGEHAISRCEMLNVLIGEKAPETVMAIAEVACGQHNETKERRITNLELEYEGKEYIVSTTSDDEGLIRAIITYKEQEGFCSYKAFEDYERMIERSSKNHSNVFLNKKITLFDNTLSNEQIALKNFSEWIEFLRNDTFQGDFRPIFMINFFEHLQEVTRNEIVAELLKLNRQIFISATRDLFENSLSGIKVNVEKVWTVI